MRKYDNGRLILKALLMNGLSGATHAKLLNELRKQHPDYPAGNLTSALTKLKTDNGGALILFNSASGRYSFADPISHAYAQAMFDKEEGKREIPKWVHKLTDKNTAEIYIQFMNKIRINLEKYPIRYVDQRRVEDDSLT